MIAEDGVVVDLVDGKIAVTGNVQCGYVYVDGMSVGEITEASLKDRLILGDEGFISVVVVVDSTNGKLVAGPEIHARGLGHRRRRLRRGPAAGRGGAGPRGGGRHQRDPPAAADDPPDGGPLGERQLPPPPDDHPRRGPGLSARDQQLSGPGRVGMTAERCRARRAAPGCLGRTPRRRGARRPRGSRAGGGGCLRRSAAVAAAASVHRWSSAAGAVLPRAPARPRQPARRGERRPARDARGACPAPW